VRKIIYITIVCALLAVIFLIKFLLAKKELRNITNQIKDYNNKKTNKKIDITLINKDIGELASEVNNLIDLHAKAIVEKQSVENELKQAVANMSHDLRTPLTSILGYIQLMEDKDTTEEDKNEYLKIAKNRTKRLQTLLNDFFELSVIESVDHDLKLESLKMNSLVEETLINLYDRFNEKQIVPSIEIPKENINIIANESALKRVIENLVTNAIKYSDGGISIKLEKLDSEVSLTISNDAKYLTKRDVELFFDRFYTADQTRLGSGTGLGLSIAKSLMSKMNGKLSASLEDNRLYMKCEWNNR
jgi:signal transduction histidine kinase